MFPGKTKIETGDFPPCPGVTESEVASIRRLTVFEDSVKTDALVQREQDVLNLLGRISKWCQAYHARIGYTVPESTKVKEEKTPSAP
jgi:hypothetical protein